MKRSRRSAIGPGLLFAGAAIGVSHLAQSTRAGAAFGVSMVVVVVCAAVIKYPAFSFGPRYAAATGDSLVEGYRRRGRWALGLYALLTVATMFTVEAAVTFFTAVIFVAVFGLSTKPILVTVYLLAACSALVLFGRYHWLDRVVKVAVVLLTLSTLMATVLVIPRVSFESVFTVPELDLTQIAFLAALIGWMPSAIDIAVWHSLWTLAKKSDTGHAPSVRDALFDFDVGYYGTMILAVCFVLLGAGVVHGTGVEVPEANLAFANMIIALYQDTLGAWSAPLIGAAACLVMFSTTLTVVDGFPRALRALAESWSPGREHLGRRVYHGSLVLLPLGSVLVLTQFLSELKGLIDLATTLSFLTAPALAWLNHRAMTAKEVPPEARPGPAMRRFSLASIGFLTAFAIGYLILLLRQAG